MSENLVINVDDVKQNTTIYSREEVLKYAKEYFKGDALASEVWTNKYALKDMKGNIYEKTPDDMHRRIASEFARIEKNFPNPLTYTEIYDLIKDFKYIVPQGSPMAGIGNNHQYVSISNCFVIGNDEDSDSYGGILKLDQELVQLMKRRAGVGNDLSFVRPGNSPVMNSALTSTGVVPFMERYSNSTREVAQGGRRGALMLSISIDHPDSESFIDAKMEQGKVTGANISVKMTDGFMKAALLGNEYKQQYPVGSNNPTFTKMVDAKTIWNKIVHNAWRSAEPGVLFWDTLIKESIPDCYSDLGFRTVSTNPCITGDTLVSVADGRNFVSISQLEKEGKDIPVYCLDNNGKIAIRTMRNPRVTGYNKKIYKVTIEGGHEIRVTGNHKFRLKDGSYVEAKDLKNGDSLHIMTKWENPIVNNSNLSKRASIELGYDNIDTDPRLVKTYKLALDNGYDANIYDNKVLVTKQCENCNNDFQTEYHRREISFCSHKCSLDKINNDDSVNNKRSLSLNNTYKFKGEETKLNQVKALSDLKFELGRKPSLKEWESKCKENEIPFRLKTKYGFKNYKEILEESELYNHKVVSVEFDGYENVYNGTVDDFHNYFSGGFKEKTKNGKTKYLSINQLNCGEIPLCPNDSCRLMALNLYSYVKNPFTKQAEFDYELFNKHTIIAQRLMDDLIELELEKIDSIINKIKNDPESDEIKRTELTLWMKIKEKCIKGRRTGLGITGEGDMLAALGIKYGTDEGNNFTTDLHMKLKHSAYDSSCIMAQERGSFPIWDKEREDNNPFLLRIKDENPELYSRLIKYGRRNIALLTIAPTGSVSILTQTSSGIEPVFMVSYMRRRKINPDDKDSRVDFIDEVGDSWQEYPVFHHKFEVYLKVNGYNVDDVKKMKQEEINAIVEKSPYFGATSNDVDWVKKVEMQGMVQKHIDHSISVTVNLPSDISEEMVAKVYETGWKSGCKGMTVYRDGSRSGVLVSSSDKKAEEKEKLFQDHHAPKRPKKLEAEIVRFQNNHEKWIAVVGTLDGRPYEMFTGKLDGLPSIPNYVERGFVVKAKTENGDGSRYDFQYQDKDGYNVTIEGLSRSFDKEFWNYAELISGVLRHGMPLPYVVDMVATLNLEDDTLMTWKNGVTRVIKKFIPDGTKSDNKCPKCDQDSLVFQEGCLTCSNCGHAKCG